MKKAIILVLFYILTISLSFGQNSQVKTVESKKSNKELNMSGSSLGLQTSALPAIDSPYFGYDNKIKSISVSDAIPVGFPTKEGFASKENYRIAINKWIKENPSFIKPQLINTEITDK